MDKALRSIGNRRDRRAGRRLESRGLDRLYDTVKREKGHIEILFANAGTEVCGTGCHHRGALRSDLRYQRGRGCSSRCRRRCRCFGRAGRSCSMPPSRASTGGPAFSVYSATKAAVRLVCATWSVDLKDPAHSRQRHQPGKYPTPGYNNGLGMKRAAGHQYSRAWSQDPAGSAGNDGGSRESGLVPGPPMRAATSPGIELFGPTRHRPSLRT